MPEITLSMPLPFLALVVVMMLIVSVLPVHAQAPAAPPGARLQRTMSLLAASTPERRHTVRVLFYGQSITEQKWWKDVADDLRARFPHADLVIENRAIGGFSANYLSRVAEHDVFAFYPDLIIFHVYGGEPEYEALVREFRSRTAAEVVLAADHVTWLPSADESRDPPDKLRAYKWHDQHNTTWLPKLAEELGCEFADVWGGWKRHLAENNLKPKDLLSDDVHLNGRGCDLMASLIKPHLRYIDEGQSGSPRINDKGLAHTYSFDNYPPNAAIWRDGKAVLEFQGNRVDLIPSPAAAGAKVTVKIDGQPPSAFPPLYTITRPTPYPGIHWPGVMRVGWEKPLVLEDWTARILDANDEVTQFRFEVTGSKTGFDGTGTSGERFVSNSGRVVIEPGDWSLARSRKFLNKPLPAGFEVKWQVRPLFVDEYIVPAIDDPANEHAMTVASGLPNEKHTLELTADTGDVAPIIAIRVYTPPVK
jgi:hypothetical protein